MKIIDRYIIRQFLKNYFISFMVLVGLYIVLDMIFNFDELMEMQSQGGVESAYSFISHAADYYAYQIFLYFAQLSGIIPIVAASFTLMRLSHFNELSALLSAGVPLLRVAAPMILTALVLNGLLLVDQEIIIPHIIPKLVRRHDEVGNEAKGSFPIRAMIDEKGSLLVVSRYFPTSQPATMYGVSIVKIAAAKADASGRLPTALITAKDATWDRKGRQWVLEGADVRDNLTAGRPVVVQNSGPTTGPTSKPTYKSNITPEEIQLYRSGEFVEMLSTQRINELLERPMSYGKLDLIRTKHARFTQVFINVILLLLAIGSVLTREPQRLKKAATKSLILCGSCLVAVFLMHQFAGQPPANPTLAENWPAIMAWVPIFIFGPTSVWLLDQIKT